MVSFTATGRLCPRTWGAGCADHYGRSHRCTRVRVHKGPCECECSAMNGNYP